MKDFAQILREKMTSDHSEKARSNHHFPSDNQDFASENSHFSSENTIFPSHLAYLMGQVPQRQWAAGMPKYAKAASSIPREKPRPHELSGRFLEAFLFFTQCGEPLSDAFSRRELKGKFRKLALKLHPDQQKGSSDAKVDSRLYIRLREALQTLLQVPTLK